MSTGFFTSESVSKGHPDKICDQISDAVLDAALEKDKQAKVACEVLASANKFVIAGEISTRFQLDYPVIVRQVLKDIGYSKRWGLDPNEIEVINLVNEQSPEIARMVFQEKIIRAGDQGIMFGYATSQTESYLPQGYLLSNEILCKLDELRLNDTPFLGPDAKSQVTMDLRNPKKPQVNQIVVSTLHSDRISLDKLRKFVAQKAIRPVLEKFGLNYDCDIFVNYWGAFTRGGPAADAGLTGRKVISDSYGGYARHGGGAFSGKDPSKVDRSGSYMARHIAKSIVSSKLAKQCEVELAFIIGFDRAVSVNIETFGTRHPELTSKSLTELVYQNFDLSVQGIIDQFKMQNIRYYPLAKYGHFGSNARNYLWEKPRFLALEKKR